MAAFNELDLRVFQFSPDLTFAVFFLNADQTIYGRFGSRTDWTLAEREMSLNGLHKAMQAVLRLHAQYPQNKQTLSGKTGPPPRYRFVKEYPQMKKRLARRPGRKVCLHCHHIGNEEHLRFRNAGKPIPDKYLFSFPMPDAVGLHMDPQHKSTVERVKPDSPAARAGLQQGDEVLQFGGQAIISTADIQWVLHHAGERPRIPTRVRREDQTLDLILKLGRTWRRNVRIGWRPTSAVLRMRVMGGLNLKDMSAAERTEAGVGAASMGLRVRTVFRNTAARKAGVRKGDVVVSFDGQSSRVSAERLLVYCAQKTTPGQQVTVVLLRMGRRVSVQLRL